MAQQTINVGTAPNDGTGDTLKASFTKCNQNFTEIYTTHAPLASPALTGVPTAPTPTVGDNTTKIATTAFVKANSGPAKIGFSAFPSADQTGVVTSVWTKVQFASTVYNDSALFNTTTHRWTPPAGRCQISAGVYYSVAVANTGVLIGMPMFISIYKNGVLFRHACGAVVSEASSGMTITIMDACNGTDYYEVFAYGTTAGNTFTINASPAAMGTFFMGTTL